MGAFRRIAPQIIGGGLVIAAVLAAHLPAAAQAPGYADITSPADGQAVQGLITIEGSASHPFFEAYDLAFAYPSDPSQTWFLITDPVNQPVADGPMAIWDTTGITDGNYRLRLRVFLTNGNILQVFVDDLRVRNYTAVETSSPGAAVSQPTPTIALPTRTPRPTPLPALTGDGSQGVFRAFTIGAILGGLTLILGGGYVIARRRMKIRLGMMRTRRMLWQQDRKNRKRD
jgi:hypothetical protein